MTSFEHVQSSGWYPYLPAAVGAGRHRDGCRRRRHGGRGTAGRDVAGTSGQVVEIGPLGTAGSSARSSDSWPGWSSCSPSAATSTVRRRVIAAFGLTALVTAVPVLPGCLPFLLVLFPFASLVLAVGVILLAGGLARWAAPAL